MRLARRVIEAMRGAPGAISITISIASCAGSPPPASTTPVAVETEAPAPTPPSEPQLYVDGQPVESLDTSIPPGCGRG